MGFATVYLRERALHKSLIDTEPKHNIGLIVIVPSFIEENICDLLDSLALCSPADCSVEVLIGVNAPKESTDDELSQNIETIRKIESWKRTNINVPFRLFVFNTGRSRIEKWGAGLARKVLMDEATRRFNLVDNPSGVIASLDADCLVSRNYLEELSRIFGDERLNGISLRFEHILPCEPGNNPIRSAIVEYELHLRYYYQALKYAAYPNVYHTVGSSFAVRASAYVKVGGMNRRQAGEDFYFIQKMIPLGGYGQNNSIIVYPSSRISTRVPFGTGPAIKSILEDSSNTFFTYNPHSFDDLRQFIGLVPNLYEMEAEELRDQLNKLPEGISKFLKINSLADHLAEIKNNSAGRKSFEKRFYNWFNMFMVVKYLNHVHSVGLYKKVPASVAAISLLGMLALPDQDLDGEGLLNYFRLLEA